MNTNVHVFAGSFNSREDACKYTEAQWEPEPDDSVSDEEYRAWEDHNPSWEMREDLGDPYLDSDLIETIDGPDRYEYLSRLLTEPGAIEGIRGLAEEGDNILALVFAEAFGGFQTDMKSTPRLKYCGRFSCKL